MVKCIISILPPIADLMLNQKRILMTQSQDSCENYDENKFSL